MFISSASTRTAVPRSVSLRAAIALCLLLVGLAGCQTLMPVQSSAAATPSMSPVDVIHRNMEAMNKEDIAGYMATIHPQGSGYAQTEAVLTELFEIYDLSTTLTDVRLESETADEARVYALMTTRKLSGPEFNNNRLDVIFILRKHQGEWKFFNQDVLDITLPQQ
jgi:murein L,D-transpeptidase YcbB/YkuD